MKKVLNVFTVIQIYRHVSDSENYQNALGIRRCYKPYRYSEYECKTNLNFSLSTNHHHNSVDDKCVMKSVCSDILT